MANAIARNTLDKLCCLDCKDLLHCGGCNVGFKSSYWTKNERHHHREERNTLLVCKECRALGKRPHDVTLYSCSGCKSQLGWAKFDAKAVDHAKQRPRRLTCQDCVTRMRGREKVLHGRLRESKMICKCFCPIHQHRCPLSLIYYGEKRWPGADGYISWFDKAFLNSLNPTPKWWTKAWGRPTT